MAAFFTRRALVGAMAAAGGATLIGCGTSAPGNAGGSAQSNASPASGKPAGGWLRSAAMTVYRDPSCGCCEAWTQIARNAGYQVELVDRADMPAIKRQHAVPEELASCHTAVVGGYAIEGHVPIADVGRLLRERPAGIRGLAVPGMPRGSPGMEMPDGAKDPFQVIAFDATGRTRVFGTG